MECYVPKQDKKGARSLILRFFWEMFKNRDVGVKIFELGQILRRFFQDLFTNLLFTQTTRIFMGYLEKSQNPQSSQIFINTCSQAQISKNVLIPHCFIHPVDHRTNA